MTAFVAAGLVVTCPAQYGVQGRQFDLLGQFSNGELDWDSSFGEQPCAFGDLNSDGVLEFLTAEGAAVAVYSIRGDGTRTPYATLRGHNSISFNYVLQRLLLADIDGDAALDLLLLKSLSTFQGTTIYLDAYRNDGTGQLVHWPSFQGISSASRDVRIWTPRTDTPSQRVVVLDVADILSHSVLRYQSFDHTQRRLTPPRSISHIYPGSVSIIAGFADLDGDEIDELVVDTATYAPLITGRLYDFRNVYVFAYNPSTGLHDALIAFFARPPQLGYSPIPVTLGDIDGDGRSEIVALLEQPSTGGASRSHRSLTARLQPGRSSTTWDLPADLIAPPGAALGPLSIAHLTDIDGDGKVDLIPPWSGAPGAMPHVHFGDGVSSFGPPNRVIPAGLPPLKVAGFGDLDGDGDQDLVATLEFQQSTNTLSAYLLRNRATDGAPALRQALFAGETFITTPQIGNQSFQVGLRGVSIGSTATLGLGLTRQSSFASDGSILQPYNWIVDPWAIGPRYANPEGIVSIALPLPPDPSIVGLGVTAQWFVRTQGMWRASAPSYFILR